MAYGLKASSCHPLTDQGVSHPLVPKEGDLHKTPLRKPLSPRYFVMNTTFYIYTLMTTIFEREKMEKNTISEWQPNKRFLARVISVLAKIWKKNLKEMFQWVLSRCGRAWINLHCWNQILDFIFITAWLRGNFFRASPSPKCYFMLINEKTTGPIQISFTSKEAYPSGWQLNAKTEIFGIFINWVDLHTCQLTTV